MNNVDRFILTALKADALPDSFSLEQVQALIGSAMEHYADKQSELDEERIRNLRSALHKIEETTTDTVAGLAARHARLIDDD
ncbi:hypothetical protein QO021_29060 (plasmid) [Pseudomonas amygdali pv. lachrymans]|uniref:Uncharacterized protein n=1 Tax=Pseudomonas syringae pv. maculicola str. ES4326 TaxID=629265 RepID=A0A8T8CAS9_PSEYM|nr:MULTISPECIES: hypothetical protein [Pseudomonas syringae group]QHF00659.1 hypothetical protein PMA4326_029625 [Pseudomonas syringae pv. maculicola str. ES4326]RMM39054.1 hypothetical protein ALQ79_200576 [Pseudomonas amygdali pv. lachrymans]UBZ00656.1 hypothetical protein LCG56_28255 [Pseudomonas cannabina pv. alisalensis]WIO61610.1 hypothetical protein QO021_29060 [Pseudomonas amygdali pv. lachrymans]